MKTLLKHTGITLGIAATLLVSCDKTDDFVNKGFDVDLFSKNLKERFDGKTVGFSFAIAQNGKIVRYDKGGLARKAIDMPETDYLVTTRQATGSCTKTLSALAILRALEAKGLNEDVYVADLLPPTWPMPQVNRKIKISHLLAHKSGLKFYGNSYADLQKTMVTATTGFGDEQKYYAYNNVNFLLCRLLIPYVAIGKNAFPANSPEAADEALSQAYRTYIREEIFKTSGLPNWDKIDIGPWNDAGTITPKNPDRQMTLYYNYSLPDLNGMMKYTTYLGSGAGGWYMNTPEMAQVLLTAEKGKLVSAQMLQRMKSKLMGFDNKKTGKHGEYFWKNGVWADDQGRGIFTVIMHFPNNVQVAWHTNGRKTNIGDPMEAIKTAYDKAWR
ncbi:MAG: serine hydrolase domain-containing protein [Chitinophaga sp.]